jgi:hypothetical protein
MEKEQSENAYIYMVATVLMLVCMVVNGFLGVPYKGLKA